MILEAARSELSPRDAQEMRVLLGALRLGRDYQRPVVFTMPVAASICGAVFWAMGASLVPVIAWVATVMFFGLMVELWGRTFDAATPGTPDEVAGFVRGHALTNLLYAAGWSAMIPLFWITGDQVNHMFITLLLAASVAASSTMNGVTVPAIAGALAPYFVLMIVWPALEGDMISLAISALSAVYAVLMTSRTLAAYQTTRNMLVLREERSELVDALVAAKADSDRAREKAEQASRAKSEFLANMSHELRTPLNAILGFSELMKLEALGPLGSDRYREYAGHIHASGEHLLNLINDVLDLAKIEAGRLQLSPEALDLGHEIAEVARLVAVRADKAGIRLVLTTEAGPSLMGDRRAVRQILLNLLSNATKFTPAGGDVRAFAKLLPDGSWTFGVADTGVGIDLADQARVFESFGQGRHDVAVTEKGSGLGLPIVKGLADAHGWTVMLESNPGQGTCVTVSAPAAAAAAAA